MNENTAVVVNGVAITPEITTVLSYWFGTVDHPHSETSPEGYVQVLVTIQDMMIDKMEETYPGIDRNLFDILSTIKSMRQEFEKLIPKKGIQS